MTHGLLIRPEAPSRGAGENMPAPQVIGHHYRGAAILLERRAEGRWILGQAR